MMFKTCSGPLPNNPSWCKLPSGNCYSRDLSVAPRRGEEHDAHDTIPLYRDTMREDAIEFGDPLVRAPTQKDLMIVECVAA